MCLPLPTYDKRALVPVVVAAAMVVIGTLAHVAYYFPRVVDDLFISLRYAENLTLGRGAVYNFGELQSDQHPARFSNMCLRLPTFDKRALVPVVVAAAMVVIGTLAHVAYYFPRVVDDLFISLRYAENLALGRGAVYNIGERVEGYSGPLWMLLQSLGFLLRVDGVTWTGLGSRC